MSNYSKKQNRSKERKAYTWKEVFDSLSANKRAKRRADVKSGNYKPKGGY